MTTMRCGPTRHRKIGPYCALRQHIRVISIEKACLKQNIPTSFQVRSRVVEKLISVAQEWDRGCYGRHTIVARCLNVIDSHKGEDDKPYGGDNV